MIFPSECSAGLGTNYCGKSQEAISSEARPKKRGEVWSDTRSVLKAKKNLYHKRS